MAPCKATWDGRGLAIHVEYLSGPDFEKTRIGADAVVLAASAIEGARIAFLCSG